MLSEDSLTALVPIGVLMLVGLALWAAGRRVMRPAFAVGGLTIGFLVGYGLATAVSLQLGDWVVGTAVGLVAASLAVLVYRLALTVVLAGVLAIAAPITVLTVAEFRGDVDALLAGEAGPESSETPEGAQTPDVDDPGAWLDERPADEAPPADGEAATADDATAPASIYAMPEITLPDQTTEQLARAGSWVERMGRAMAQEWRDAPERLRPTIMLASVCGAIVGVIVGTTSMALSSAVVSAFGGSLVMLVSGRAAIEVLGDGLERLIPGTMTTMLVVWLILAVVGLVIQWTLRPSAADKAA